MQQKMKQTEVIHQYADLVGFRIGQLSTDFTETVPLEGCESEWKKAKETLHTLGDIYSRLETDQFEPEPDDKEKLYDIIRHVLQSDLTIHIKKLGSKRETITLFSVPDGNVRHGIKIEVKVSGSVRKIINHSFF